jgi:hypothetical protein
VLASLAAILFPGRRVGVEVAAGRYGWPFLYVVVAAALAAVAIGARLDLEPEVLAENARARPAVVTGVDQGPGVEIKTDREIAEDTAQRTAVKRVMLGLGAGLGTPARVLGLALALFLLGRYVGGTPTMPRSLAAAALVALPGALRSLVTALAAWHQPSIGTRDIDALLASARVPVPAGHPGLERLLGGVDVFTLWSAVILGFALAAAAELPRTKAFVAAAVGFVLYLLVTGLIMGAGS